MSPKLSFSISLKKSFTVFLVLNIDQSMYKHVQKLDKGWCYLYIGHPKQCYIEDTVRDESSQVQSQEVKVETYNTENKLG